MLFLTILKLYAKNWFCKCLDRMHQIQIACALTWIERFKPLDLVYPRVWMTASESWCFFLPKLLISIMGFTHLPSKRTSETHLICCNLYRFAVLCINDTYLKFYQKCHVYTAWFHMHDNILFKHECGVMLSCAHSDYTTLTSWFSYKFTKENSDFLAF